MADTYGVAGESRTMRRTVSAAWRSDAENWCYSARSCGVISSGGGIHDVTVVLLQMTQNGHCECRCRLPASQRKYARIASQRGSRQTSRQDSVMAFLVECGRVLVGTRRTKQHGRRDTPSTMVRLVLRGFKWYSARLLRKVLPCRRLLVR